MERAPLPPPYATIVFDCDSTLSGIEGIEELAEDKKDEIRELTNRAMNGELPLEAVYGARLEAIQPSAQEIAAIGQLYYDHLAPHAAELIAALQFLGKRVCVVSGGVLEPVRDLAVRLGIDANDVQAVEVRHDSDGKYLGFDEDSPLTRAGGKIEVVGRLATGPGARPPVALIGDGATDLEAAVVCGRFVAYGGVDRREPVFAGADVTCEVHDFAALVPLLLADDEIERLHRSPDHAPLARAAREFTSTGQ